MLAWKVITCLMSVAGTQLYQQTCNEAALLADPPIVVYGLMATMANQVMVFCQPLAQGVVDVQALAYGIL